MDTNGLVQPFWDLMNSGDFNAVRAVVHPDLVVEWPQTNERIVGVDNFVTLNADYPAAGRWVFTVHQVVEGDGVGASDVTFTDGVAFVRVLTFFTYSGGKVAKLVEYFPEPYDPPTDRSHLTEPLTV